MPAVTSHAQSVDASLAAVDSLIAQSRFRDAGARLDQWEKDNASRVTPGLRATALLLRARLTQDADAARALYQELSLGYPSSPEAAVALLRLGQLAYANNDVTRATSYLQRVVSDYPASPAHDDAVAWLAKVGTPAPRSTPQAPPKSVPPSTANAAAAYALQVAAFKDARNAETLARQLTQRGFDARVRYIPGSALARVRVGRFASTRAADDPMRRLRAAGFEAVVVDDARIETDRPR